VPVFQGTIDNITGIAFAHDLLQITDVEARTRNVASIQRPVVFVPETKRGYELLREMQREKQHMRIVIDEYGSVAGLVTIEDLLEQIVGEIRDEHEDDAPAQVPQRQTDGSWVVPGSFAVDQLGNLFDLEIDIPEGYEATTVGGLVSELEGRIPLAGEVVVLDSARLRMEVVASTDRRVDRVRVFPPASSPAAGALEKARERA
jgi:CBS domain containing-hemolysin-like protein